MSNICLNSKINDCKNIISQKGSVLCDHCNIEKHNILQNKISNIESNVKNNRESEIYNLRLKIQYFTELKNGLLTEKTQLLEKIIELQSVIEKLSIENKMLIKENEFYKNSL
jgi:hypothetical protein